MSLSCVLVCKGVCIQGKDSYIEMHKIFFKNFILKGKSYRADAYWLRKISSKRLQKLIKKTGFVR